MNLGQAKDLQVYRIKSITQKVSGHSHYRPEQTENKPKYDGLL